VAQDGGVTFLVPANLAASMQLDGSVQQREWLARLPEVVQDLATRWAIVVEAPFEPGGTAAWVAPARDESGRDLVLKVGWAHPEAADEATGLRRWAGRGAVLLYRAQQRDSTSALLLERCRPGQALGSVRTEPEQDVIVAGLLRQLWAAGPGEYSFRPLQVMCDAWADEFERDWARTPDAVDPGLARLALELLRGLPASASQQVLLCTDLHAANIVSAEREPWLVIDPKPYLGDPAYDVIQHLLNCEERLTTDPVALVARMSYLLDLDAERVAAWLFARCVQESIDQPWLRSIAPVLAPA
jgi:streptomycin 6-kinase